MNSRSDEDVRRAAHTIIDFYRESALERARMLEVRLGTNSFAAQVREYVERHQLALAEDDVASTIGGEQQ